MSVKVRIPTPLQRLAENNSEVQIQALSIAELLDNLDKKYPGLKMRICEEDGKIRKFINLYVNQEDIRFLEGESTKLKDGDEVSIIPAIAGGK